ncbi:MAG: choline/ethanolamine kinase family protein [Gammaproteobacteria bacterium]
MAQDSASAAGAGVTAEALAHVPGCERGERPLSIEPLAGGSTDRSVLVRTHLGEFVVRSTIGRAGAIAVDRHREALLQAIAARAGLAPNVVWADPAAEALVSEYAGGREWTPDDMGDARQLERLGERLRALHALPSPELVRFDPVATAARYRAGILERAAELDAWVEEIRTIVPLVTSERRAAAIIHGDLHHSNIVEAAALVLIDWEYATLADPLFDLGCVLAYYPGARAHSARFLAAAGLAGSATPAELLHACRLYERLTALWTRAVTAGAGPGESAD